MTWARVDDTFHHHPKLLNVRLAAIGLFALGLSYAADNETNGRLPEKWVLGRIVGDDQAAPDELVSVGLWLREGAEFVIHDYADYNLTSEELERRRADWRQRKRRGDRSPTPPVPQGKPQGKPGGNPQGSPQGSPGLGLGQGTRLSSTTSSSATSADFEEWLTDYRSVTGRTTVRGSRPARDQFAARLREGYSLEDLKLATAGCHGDEFCRSHGHDVPETILRASKITRYIELGRNPARARGSSNERLDELIRRAQAHDQG